MLHRQVRNNEQINCRKNKRFKKYYNFSSFFDGKYTGSNLIANTHIVIVYNGKNNVPSRNIPLSYSPKVKRFEKGKLFINTKGEIIKGFKSQSFSEPSFLSTQC